MKVLKNAAKTRKVAAEVVLSALTVIEKAKLDPSGFLNTLGGSKSPGRTWMLIFTAEVSLLVPLVLGGLLFSYVTTASFCAEEIGSWTVLPPYCYSEVRCCCKLHSAPHCSFYSYFL